MTGAVLVVAGPGTGKTAVVTHRIARQIRSGIAPERVLVVTFTERAAGELLRRLRDTGVPVGAGGVSASTFHAAALRQLREHWPTIAECPFPKLVESKGRLVAQAVERRRGLLGQTAVSELVREIDWVKAQGIGSGEPRTGAAAREALARLDLTGAVPRWVCDTAAYQRSLAAHEGPWPARATPEEAAEGFAEIFARYEDRKAREGSLDFDDLLAACQELIRVRPDVQAEVRGRFSHFTVDEFQDVNRLQWDLLLAWVGDGEDVCVVGDADQAIFGFTGASPRYLGEFRRRFPLRTEVRLKQNYRSTQPILDLATAVLPGPARGAALVAERGRGPEPLVVGHATAAAEQRWVLERCSDLHQTGVAWAEMAILYRTNAQVSAWESALSAARIPHVVRDGEAAAGSRRDPDAVNLLTLHRSKGLEFDAVFVVETEEGWLPIAHAVRQDDVRKLSAEHPASKVAEEARLLYVGLTRARTHLHVSWSTSARRPGAKSRRATRFLREVLARREARRRRRRGWRRWGRRRGSGGTPRAERP